MQNINENYLLIYVTYVLKTNQLGLLIYQEYFLILLSILGFINDFDVPAVVHNQEEPIYTRIFYLIHFWTTLVLIDLFNTTLSLHQTEGSGFIDQHHQHTLTGNSKIIRQDRLGRFVINRTKYRKNKTVFFWKAEFDIIVNLNEPILTWETKHGYGKYLFNEWKSNRIKNEILEFPFLSRKLNIKEPCWYLKEAIV